MTWIGALVLFLAATQGPAPASIRGTVVSADTREPLPLSIVTLIPAGRQQFTDAAGGFAIAGLSSGTYLLRARQIGYVPLDTQVVLREGSALTLIAVLRHLAIELPPVTITLPARCTTPGPPDTTNPALAAVFDQLEENARRFALLADSFPFDYRIEQTVREVTPRGDTLRALVDTLQLGSRLEPPYRVGRVVTPSYGPWRGDYVVRTLSLQEFGNAAFVHSHCFRLAGMDTIAGERLLRIDFEPAARIASADMAGSAYLDSVTYRLRFTQTALTHPENSPLDHVAAISARTRFREVAPGISLQEELQAVTRFRYGRLRRRVETQRTLDTRFRRPLPQ
ncbi:MAG: carboxypeptidase regulatory-like domain-containing protein [Gemmatimonadales bacterium]